MDYKKLSRITDSAKDYYGLEHALAEQGFAVDVDPSDNDIVYVYSEKSANAPDPSVVNTIMNYFDYEYQSTEGDALVYKSI